MERTYAINNILIQPVQHINLKTDETLCRIVNKPITLTKNTKIPILQLIFNLT